ncbi:MAG: alanine:cation symporter family protein [Ruminococcus sp.]|nr:alanine:cation symporter family protein [Ruminococcus sp.]
MDAFLKVVEKINDAVNGVVWGWPALILLCFTGVLMTVLTKFFQVSHFGKWVGSTIGAIFKDKNVTKHTEDKSISQFQSLCTALAATVGTGNIAGVASAIATGGPGAIFWMWVVAFFGMMTNYSENVLGILYRIKNKNGEWSGGAMYYLRYGLGSKKNCKGLGKFLAALFCVFCLLASFGIGNMTQINTISTNMKDTFHVPTIISGIMLMIVAGLVIIGGLKRIAAVTEKIVPAMVLLYLVGTIVICIMHIDRFGEVFTAIFKGAFGLKAAAGGIVGSGVKMAVQMGMKRGVFSNEAGLGSSVMVHSSSNVKEPVHQGMWGIFEVFTDTIVVCTLTAFTVLSSGLIDLETGKVVDGVENTGSMVGMAFGETFGKLGTGFVAIALLLFAFSTVLGWSHYGSKAMEYLFGEKATMIYKIVFVAAIIGGATMGENLAWDLSDTFNGLMMLPNLVGVLTLSPMVYRCTKNYVDRHMRHMDVEPVLSAHDDIQREQAAALAAGDADDE